MCDCIVHSSSDSMIHFFPDEHCNPIPPTMQLIKVAEKLEAWAVKQVPNKETCFLYYYGAIIEQKPMLLCAPFLIQFFVRCW